MPNCFIFRTDSNEFVQRELQVGRLRQGWSPPGTSLLDDYGEERDKEEWEQAYREAWNEAPSKLRHAILRRMLDINSQNGDIVICPKAPDHEHFTIARAYGKYDFEDNDVHRDFGHVIPVRDQRVVSNWHDEDARTIFEQFKRAYSRAAVTQVPEGKNQQILEAATRLLANDDARTPGDPVGIRQARYDRARRQAAQALMETMPQCCRNFRLRWS